MVGSNSIPGTVGGESAPVEGVADVAGGSSGVLGPGTAGGGEAVGARGIAAAMVCMVACMVAMPCKKACCCCAMLFCIVLMAAKKPESCGVSILGACGGGGAVSLSESDEGASQAGGFLVREDLGLGGGLEAVRFGMLSEKEMESGRKMYLQCGPVKVGWICKRY